MSKNKAIERTYHHGDLAQSLIVAAAALLAENGPGQISLREIARNAGVSHGAPAHHFGDKPGLLTAVAIRGHEILADALTASQQAEQPVYDRLVAAGIAYVQFALKETGYFSVMFQSDLINDHAEDFIAARLASRRVLINCLEELAGEGVSQKNIFGMQTALWSQVHGFSVLWLSGNFGDPKDHSQLEPLLAEMLRSIEPRVVAHSEFNN